MSLRLVEDAAKEFCRHNYGYTYKSCLEIEADRAIRDMELIFLHAKDFNVVDVPQDVMRMLDELHNERDNNTYAAPEQNTQRSRYLETTQPEWYGVKRAERKREWEYAKILRASGQNHYFNCRELLQQGVYECKHFDCKCPCHQRLNDARTKCLHLSQTGAPHNDCACACHVTA